MNWFTSKVGFTYRNINKLKREWSYLLVFKRLCFETFIYVVLSDFRSHGFHMWVQLSTVLL